jgi:hypothetical protein
MERVWDRKRCSCMAVTHPRLLGSFTECNIGLQPFTSDYPRGDIYEMISPDLLHQLIKGTFKDHLVTWVCEYIILKNGERKGNIILDDIDRR